MGISTRIKNQKEKDRDDGFCSSLISPMFLEAASAIYWTALSWLERNFGFSATVRTGDLVHGSAAVSSFFAHTPLTPLY
jgi:hypothetical protein